MIIHTLLFTLIVTVTSALKILVVFPYPGKSHSLLGEGYVRNLLKAGHEVTYITPISIKNASERLRQIDVSANLKLFEADLFNFENIMRNKLMLQDKPFILQVCNGIANHTLWNPNVRRLIMDPKEHFDVVIAEWLYTEMYCGFSAVFNCPFIWSSSMDPHGLVLSLIDENPNPAYTANHMSALDPPFTFLQRVEELWEVFYMEYLKWSMSDIENQIFQRGYGPAVAKRGRVLPSLYEVSRNGSLMLGNSHVSTGRSLRLPQNYIPIAGYHIDEEGKPLPEDLQTIMDNSKHGVIYFSMGTMLKSKTMPEALKNEFLEMFGGLKQTVIWKLEEDLPNLPKNVHLLQWAPQASILAHPKCILFITHGGLLSTTEAVKNGVPIIGIPMFADQFINIDRAVRKGFAMKVDFDYDTPKQLKVAIEDIVGDSRYRTKAQELSFIYHHRPMSPGQELVHWVEHVVKTRGAPHLRSPALIVPFYQKLYLDLAGILLLILIVFKAIVTAVLRRVFQSKKETEKKKKG